MSLRETLLKTLAFFDLFDQPLKPEEVLACLYEADRSVHIKEVRGTLEQMKEEGLLEQVRDFYALKGRGGLAEMRHNRAFLNEKLWMRVRLFARLMAGVPFIRMIAVCNTLAFSAATPESDIDLFVVTKPGRLWTSRLFLTALLHFFGVRRHGPYVAGRFCLSFFVTENALKVSDLTLPGGDPYLHYWMRTLKPFYGRPAYERFLSVNRVAAAEAPAFLVERDSLFKRVTEAVLAGPVGNAVEFLIKKILKPRTQKKAGALGGEACVVVSDDMLKFHNHDRRAEYRELWHQRWSAATASASDS